MSEATSAPARGPRPATPACPHCGTAVEGSTDSYCCGGCEMAAAIIRGAGLERYYVERRAPAPRPEPVHGDWGAVAVETIQANGKALCEARLAIDGLRCASCVWVTERVLEQTPGVRGAMVSYATGRASIRWDPARIDLPTLARRIAALGYRPRPLGVEPRPDHDLLIRLGVAAFAALNIMLLAISVYVGWWDVMDQRFAALFRWVTLVLATPVALWCAGPFYAAAISGLRHRRLQMDLPIALAVIVLYAHGLFATLHGQDGYLDSLAMLVALLLAGRMLEARGRRRAAESATALAAVVPRTARRAVGDSLETVSVDALRAGDQIDVGAGEELAADGVIVEGSGQLRMAILTGESAPVLVGPGERVVAGALLADGALTVRVEAVGDATVIRRMAAELERAADRAITPDSADRLAPWFTAATLVLGLGTLLYWWHEADVAVAIGRTIAVLVVACPCALALSRPLAAAAGLGAAARRGLLLRSGDALLALAGVDYAALDKTGTVTAGSLSVVEADDAALRIAAGLERFSQHPIARAIVAEAVRRGIPLPHASAVRETAGRGIEGWLDGKWYALTPAGAGEVALHDAPGQVRAIRLGDQLRDDSHASVAGLERLGLQVALLSGDNVEVARRIAVRSGIREFAAPLSPGAKAAWIVARQQSGRRVLFAGDGLNDGPALAAADVGVAMATGAASSVLMADGVIASPSLAPLLAGIRAARAARAAIRTSQRRSIAYNVLAVTAASLGLINPLVAAVLMPLSSAMVIWQAAQVEAAVRSAES